MKYVTMGLAAISAIVMITPAAQAERRPEHQAKRLKQMANLTPEYFASKSDIQDDALESTAVITTANGFQSKGGFTDAVRTDNFLRAYIDKASGRTRWQLYQTFNYTGDWRRYSTVNVVTPAGLRPLPLAIIDRSVVTCEYGVCVLREIVGFDISEADLESIAVTSGVSPIKPWQFRFKSDAGLDWTDDMAPAEVAGALIAVKRYRQAHKL